MHNLLAAAVCLALGVATTQAAPVRVVCLGDSITRGVRTGVTEAQTYAFRPMLFGTELFLQNIRSNGCPPWGAGAGAQQRPTAPSQRHPCRLPPTVTHV